MTRKNLPVRVLWRNGVTVTHSSDVTPPHSQWQTGLSAQGLLPQLLSHRGLGGEPEPICECTVPNCSTLPLSVPRSSVSLRLI